MNAIALRHDTGQFPETTLTRECAQIVLRSAQLLAPLLRVAKKKITSKRQGAKGLAARRILSYYLIELGYQVHQLAMAFGVYRDQPSDDARLIEKLSDKSPVVSKGMEQITRFLDAGLAVQRKPILELCGMTAREIARYEAPDAEPEPEPINVVDLLPLPVSRAPWNPATQKRPTPQAKEAERVQAELQEKRRHAVKVQALAICESIIKKGTAKGASRDARKLAEKAELAYKEISGAGYVAAGHRLGATKEERALAKRAESAVRAMVGDIPDEADDTEDDED